MWLSSDPALGEYIPKAPLTDEDKEANKKLPGMGGIYNPINFALYHFAGNNPVKFVDPDGLFQVYRSVDAVAGKEVFGIATAWGQGDAEGWAISAMEGAVGFIPFAGGAFATMRKNVTNFSDLIFGTNSKMIFDSMEGPPGGGDLAFDTLETYGGTVGDVAGTLGLGFDVSGLFTELAPRMDADRKIQNFLNLANYSILGKATNQKEAISMAGMFADAAQAYYDKNLESQGISMGDWSAAIQTAMQGNPNELYQKVMED